MLVRWSLTAAVLAGCAGDLTLPTPPDLAPLNQLYETPTLELSAATAERVLDRFVARAGEIDELDELRPITRELINFHDEVEPGAEGEPIRLRGVPLDFDAHIDVFVDCPGTGDGADEDAVILEAIVKEAALVPVVFGEARDCGYSRTVGGQPVSVVVGGELAAFLPNILDKQLPRVVLVRFDFDEVDLAGVALPPRAGNLRLVDRRLELLVSVDQEGNAVGVREPAGRIGVRASNGEWLCSTEERTCERSSDPSDSFGF